jgi:hypothetical protein
MDYREILWLSQPAYLNATIPESWRVGFGRMYEEQEDPEAESVEVTDPTFREYVDYLGHPGGVTRFLSDDGQGGYDEADVDSCDWVAVQIPWDRVTAEANISAMKEDLATLLGQGGATYHGRMLNAIQWQRDISPKINTDTEGM